MAAGIDRWKRLLGSQFRPKCVVTALVDGTETFKAFDAAIRTAINKTHYVYLLAWYVDDLLQLTDAKDSTLSILLRDASQKGAQVRLMAWDQVGRQNSAVVDRVNQLPGAAAILDNNTLRFGAHHQKVLIVKGTQGLIAFCGGVDVNEDRIHAVKRSPGSPYHDVHCRIQGAAAHDLLDVFVQRWLSHPAHASLDEKQGMLRGLPDRLPIATPSEPMGEHFVRIGRTFNFIGNGRTCAKERTIREVMTGAIRAATRFIYIEDQYLVNFAAALELRRALSHLQHLTIVIPHSSLSDLPQVQWARAEFVQSLQKGDPGGKKVRVFYRYTPGAKPELGLHSYVHAKTWIFDDELAVIGSANCNNRGWSYDSEVVAAFGDKAASVRNMSLPQILRARLWAEHLGVSPSDVRDGVANADAWLKLPSTAQVKRYDLAREKVGISWDPLEWYSEIDPSADNLPKCGEGTNVTR